MTTQRTQAPIFLNQYLEAFHPHLTDPTITEICVNTQGGYWIETQGEPRMTYIQNPAIQNDHMARLARLVAQSTHQTINEHHPLLSASLPTGERIQFALPPVARNGVALTIRKSNHSALSLEDFDQNGAFKNTKITNHQAHSASTPQQTAVNTETDIKTTLKAAIQSHKNIIISGGTSTGKTALLNALLQTVPDHERIITIEDTPELTPPQPNHLALIASRGEQGKAHITIQDLLEASLRLRPDRIFLGELRGREAFTYLRSINTGHPGSLTSIHADTPTSALSQIALMVMQSQTTLTFDQILTYITAIIDIVIQLKRNGGQREVSEIWMVK